MKKSAFIGLAILFSCFSAKASDVVFADGSTKILVDNKQNKMFCTNCGGGNEVRLISGPVPGFEGIGSGVEKYFKEEGILIVRTDMGTSCLSGQYIVIDLNVRTSKELNFPSCNEAQTRFSSEKGKAIMRIKQGKKVTVFKF